MGKLAFPRRRTAGSKADHFEQELVVNGEGWGIVEALEALRNSKDSGFKSMRKDWGVRGVLGALE